MDDRRLGEILGGMNQTEFENVLRPHLKEMTERTTSPDTMLICLYSSGVFGMMEMEDIKAKRVDYRINEAMYTKIIMKNKGKELISALSKCNQGHIIQIIKNEVTRQTLEKQKEEKLAAIRHAEVKVAQNIQFLNVNAVQNNFVVPSGVSGSATEPVDLSNLLQENLDPWKNLVKELTNSGGATMESKLMEFKRQEELLNMSALIWQDSLLNKMEDCYRIRGQGHALIINNKFDRVERPRDPNLWEKYDERFRGGASNDTDTLVKLCATLKLCVTCEENVSSVRLYKVIEDFQKNCTLKKCGFTIVFFMTHGGLKSETLLMDDLEEIDLHRDLIQKFGRADFPYGNEHGGGLDGMPKLFFVQACRNYVVEPPPLPKTDSAALPKQPKTDASVSRGDEFEVSNFSDIFLGQSAMPRYVSYRDEDLGSFYIRAIAAIFENYYQDLHLLKLVEKSGDLVKNYCEAYNQKALAANAPEKRLRIQIPEIRMINFNKKFRF